MTTYSSYLLIFSVLAAPPAKEKQDALQSIESTRGGRHWVDAKTDPPKSPEDSKKCLQLEPGLRIELFAAEPLVMDPVAIAFDRYATHEPHDPADRWNEQLVLGHPCNLEIKGGSESQHQGKIPVGGVGRGDQDKSPVLGS